MMHNSKCTGKCTNSQDPSFAKYEGCPKIPWTESITLKIST